MGAAWSRLSLRGRLFLLALLPLLASLALIALAVRQQESELAAREHALVRASYMEARRTELKHYVDLAVSTIKPLLGQAGGQDRALSILQSLDYGRDGYFFVYDLQGRVLMHSRQPELIGQNLWELRDPQGRPTIQQLIGQAKAGGGYVEYSWRKPSSSQLAPKLGYVVAVPEWDWMLGTGLYLDGIEATMAELEQGARQNITATMLWVGAVAVFGVALISAGALALNLSEHRSAEAKLRALAREVVHSQEDERARLARELHDGVSQALVATKLLIESAQSEPASAARLQALALKRLNSTLSEVRHLSHALRPALLDTLGLPAALQHLAGEFDAAGGTHFKAVVAGEEFGLPDAVNTALFRIAQEALNNAARHAQATVVTLTLRFEPSGGLMLEVHDDGRGFDAEAAQAVADRGLGLRSMRERADALGARLSLMTSAGVGCRLAVKLSAADIARASLA
ncbi:cache domain-containing protein [Roseateles puraquae]|uniref:Histidine kinase n=1 Tax=Roseateles puraquae TaxID=431059 RepID=A0A254N3F4_9BURK|nr:cache domain-containing protein [Roseateles puraquae]MDG0855509.1 histidine kinase [Roseateles puraquae]OWR02360.1 histidine kinase [Roseateles puraquae]